MSTRLAERPRVREFSPDVGGGREADPYPQASFYYDREHFYPAYFGGVGIGKTLALMMDFFAYAHEYPRSRQIITEPSYQMVRDILIPTIMDQFGDVEGRAFTMTRSAPFNLTFPSGSELWLRSTETGQRMYGPNVARVGMDEVTLGHQQEQHGILAQRCRQPGFRHQLKVTGTPKGRNWTHSFYVANPTSDVKVYMAETRDNQYLPRGYVDRLLELYGGPDTPLARQELGGAWISMVGPVYPQFSRREHVREISSADAWRQFKRRVGGIDFGGVSPTALIAGGLDGKGRAWAYNEWYRHQASLDEVVEVMASWRDIGIGRWMADPSGKQEIAFLRRQGFTVQPALHGNDIKLRVQLVGARLNLSGGLPGCYFTPACPNLITEIEGLAWQRVKLAGRLEEIMTDQFERGAPDHAQDAWANILSDFDGTRRWTRPKLVKVYGDL